MLEWGASTFFYKWSKTFTSGFDHSCNSSVLMEKDPLKSEEEKKEREREKREGGEGKERRKEEESRREREGGWNGDP